MAQKAHSAHEVVAAIKNLASIMGRAPSRDEFRERSGITDHHMRQAFNGSYSAALFAAGFTHDAFNRAGLKQPQKFKYITQKLQGFFVDTVDLKELFDRAGNPEVLKGVAVPDTHVPNHDEQAVNASCKFLDYYKPDILIIMGDFLDVEPLSHWPAKDLKPRRFVPDALVGRKILSRMLTAASTSTSRFYLEGNHEDWINQTLIARLPELADGIELLLPEGTSLDLSTFLELKKHNIELLKLNRLLQIGRAYFTHGLFTNDHHPKKTLDTLGKNIYYGHLHDVKGYNKMSVDGPIEAQSLGCLSRLDAPFMKGRPNNWVHALGIYEFFPDGSFTFSKPCIFGGRFAYNGIVFDGN